jgi:hypothetical protein
MFVRFRKQGHRLGVSLMQTRRVGVRVQSEHVAALGSVDDPPSVRERFAFWAALPERLARLGNRLAASEHAKIIGALHARIPMVTPDDQRAIQEENAKDEERFWDAMRDLGAATIEGHKGQIATGEAAIAEAAPHVATATENVERAKDRLKRLQRGETVTGGLGKRMDMDALFERAGFTKRALRRCRLMADLTPDELETLINQIPREIELANNARERAARKIIRERRGVGGP